MMILNKFPTRYWFYLKLISIPIIWYAVGFPDKKDIQRSAFNKGYCLSQKFKKIPHWDQYAEPLFISQFSNIFSAGYSFIEGMISDNEDQETIQNQLNSIRHEILSELKEKELPKE